MAILGRCFANSTRDSIILYQVYNIQYNVEGNGTLSHSDSRVSLQQHHVISFEKKCDLRSKLGMSPRPSDFSSNHRHCPSTNDVGYLLVWPLSPAHIFLPTLFLGRLSSLGWSNCSFYHCSGTQLSTFPPAEINTFIYNQNNHSRLDNVCLAGIVYSRIRTGTGKAALEVWYTSSPRPPPQIV